jgi:ribonuclease BN (tRNA processing enzyme)
MEFYLVGTGTLVPDAERGPSGYAVRGAGNALMLVDGGAGTLRTLAGIGLDFREITSCLYTHRHPDHTADLFTLLFARKHVPAGEDSRLAVWGPSGFPDFVRRVQEAWQGWVTPGDRCEVSLQEFPMEGEPIEVSGLEVRTWRVDHSDPGVALRFRDPGTGGTLCYSGDTQYCEGLVEAARDADVLVVECSFPDDQAVEGHMTPRSVARTARDSGARRVILTHMYPVVPAESLRVACERALDRPVELGADGMSVLL